MGTIDLTTTDYINDEFGAAEVLDCYRSIGVTALEHDGVIVAVGDQRAVIDTALAPLIYTMWKLGIKTDESCQDVYREPDEDPKALIGFDGINSASLFLSLIAPHDAGQPGGLADRATGSNLDPDSDRTWEWTWFPRMEGLRVEWSGYIVIDHDDVEAVCGRLLATS